MVYPIYINEACISSNEYKKLQNTTFRPIILTLGDPNKAVLDSQKSLRDYFAGHAMKGLFCSYSRGCGWSEEMYRRISKSAYCIADAMLKEREKEVK